MVVDWTIVGRALPGYVVSDKLLTGHGLDADWVWACADWSLLGVDWRCVYAD